MPIAIEKLREAVDLRYVGLRANTDKVRPVHIANGLFRTVMRETRATRIMNQFVFYQSHKGDVPKGHELDTLFPLLLSEHRLDPSINQQRLQQFRMALNGVLDADNGVYPDGMASYSAGYKGFITRDTIGQDAGEFVGLWLRSVKSPLASCLEDSLHDDGDLVTTLCLPLLADEPDAFEPTVDWDELHCQQLLRPSKGFQCWQGLAMAAATLAEHLSGHPDKLFRLRLAALFAGMLAFRHLLTLEAYYDESAAPRILPILLDYGTGSQRELADASKQSFSRGAQSVVRFYGWAFAEELKADYTVKELLDEDVPRYKGHTSAGAQEVWNTARTEVARRQNKFEVFGEGIYDILALEAQADPIRYLKRLGRYIGLLHPGKTPAPWFSPRQDITELLLYCTVAPNETVTSHQVLSRLWDRFGIIVGGRPSDEATLTMCGILSWDRDSLRSNTRRFVESLAQLDFATHLADGVLRVTVGGTGE